MSKTIFDMGKNCPAYQKEALKIIGDRRCVIRIDDAGVRRGKTNYPHLEALRAIEQLVNRAGGRIVITRPKR